MRAMVTGATGFLGGHLVRSLAEGGTEVTALVRPTSKVSSELRESAQLVEGDLRSGESLMDAITDADVVYHCAALTTNRTPWQAQYETNIRGTARVLEAALEGGAQRAVHISSVMVYGLDPPRNNAAFTETSPYVQNPDRWGYYARSKAEADELALNFCREKGFPVTVMRLGILYGPGGGMPGQQQLGRFGPVRLLVGNGRNVLPFTYVENAVDCVLLAAASDDAAGQAYNVVDEPQISGREAISERASLTYSRPVLVSVPAPLLDIAAVLVELPSNLSGADTPPPLTRHLVRTACRDIRYDSSKAREHLGWRQRYSLEDGLRRTLGRDGP
jgi:nucleoside-diphosphate-sugar epimerase